MDDHRQLQERSPARERSNAQRGIGIIETAVKPAPVSITMEIQQLEQLDPQGLKFRWRAVTGRPAPSNLPKFLMVRVLAYGLQVDAHGDLEKETRTLLDRVAAGRVGKPGKSNDGKASHPASLSALGIFDPRVGRLQPGCVLVREHGGVTHHVSVLADGFAWNGQRFASLSSVALAITGTSWNGRRFFGIDRRSSNPDKTPSLRKKKTAGYSEISS